jgi:hypothetical protein
MHLEVAWVYAYCLTAALINHHFCILLRSLNTMAYFLLAIRKNTVEKEGSIVGIAFAI